MIKKVCDTRLLHMIASNHCQSFLSVVNGPKSINSVVPAVCECLAGGRCCLLPVGWAVGSLAGTTQRGRRKESQSEHHRAVIPLDEEVRCRAVRPDSNLDNILRLHTVQQKGGYERRKNLSSSSPSLTWNNQQTWERISQSWTRKTGSRLDLAERDRAPRREIHIKKKKIERSVKKCPGVCAYADIPLRSQGLGWKSFFAVFLRGFLWAPDS